MAQQGGIVHERIQRQSRNLVLEAYRAHLWHWAEATTLSRDRVDGGGYCCGNANRELLKLCEPCRTEEVNGILDLSL